MRYLLSIITFGSLILDSTPQLQASDEPLWLRTRNIEIPVESEEMGAAAIEGLMLWVTRDGGISWDAHPRIFHEIGPLRFDAPTDGLYGFRVVARDRAGQIQDPPQPGDTPEVSCVIDTTPPTLEVITPTQNDHIYAGNALEIRWIASDAALGENPVKVDHRRSLEEPWSPIIEARTFGAGDTIQWWPPYVSGSFELRVTAEDSVGNRTEWITPRPLQVVSSDSSRESDILAAESVTNFKQFPIYYRSPRYSQNEISRVEIWVRRGFDQWRPVFDPDRKSPYHFTAQHEGDYEFYLRTVNQNGRDDRPAPGPDTPADLRVSVDTLPPLVTLRVNDGHPLLAQSGGDPLTLSWTCRDEDPLPHGARIECSIDGRKTWQILHEIEHLAAGEGTFNWIPPMIETESLDLRIVARDRAGNQASVLAPTRIQLFNPRVDRADLAMRRHQRAIVLADRKDRRSLELALEELALVVQITPENSDAWHDQGVLQTRLGHHVKALASYRRSLELKPADPGLSLSVIQGHLNMFRSEPDQHRSQLTDAKKLFRQISKVQLYENRDFRVLLNRYRSLEEALERAASE